MLDGVEVLDRTSIHPESYDIANKLLEELEEDEESIGTGKLIKKLDTIKVADYVENLNTDIYTLEDVIT